MRSAQYSTLNAQWAFLLISFPFFSSALETFLRLSSECLQPTKIYLDGLRCCGVYKFMHTYLTLASVMSLSLSPSLYRRHRLFSSLSCTPIKLVTEGISCGMMRSPATTFILINSRMGNFYVHVNEQKIESWMNAAHRTD